jgi:hypothetical protein
MQKPQPRADRADRDTRRDRDYVLHGALTAQDYDHEVEAYLGEDERIYVYRAGRQRLHEVDSPQDLGEWLADGLYVDAMRGFGQRPMLHIGKPDKGAYCREDATAS